MEYLENNRKESERKLFEKLCEIFEKQEITQLEAIEFSRMFREKLQDTANTEVWH